MDRAWAANLIPGSLVGNEADQPQDFSHGHLGPCLPEANTWHERGPRALSKIGMHQGVMSSGTEKRNPYEIRTASKMPRLAHANALKYLCSRKDAWDSLIGVDVLPSGNTSTFSSESTTMFGESGARAARRNDAKVSPINRHHTWANFRCRQAIFPENNETNKL